MAKKPVRFRKVYVKVPYTRGNQVECTQENQI